MVVTSFSAGKGDYRASIRRIEPTQAERRNPMRALIAAILAATTLVAATLPSNAKTCRWYTMYDGRVIQWCS